MSKMIETVSDVQIEIHRINQIDDNGPLKADKDKKVERLVTNIKEKTDKTTVQIEQVIAAEGRVIVPNELKQEAQIRVAQLFLLIQTDYIKPPSPSRAVLNHLMTKSLNPDVALALEPIVHRYSEEEMKISEKSGVHTSFEHDIARLIQYSPDSAEILKNCLIASATELGTTRENIEKKFESFKKNRISEHNFKIDWEQGGLSIPFTDDDRPLVEALYSPDRCLELFESIKQEMILKYADKNLSNQVLNQYTSQEIQDRIVLLFDKILQRIDTEKSSKEFSTLITEQVGQFITIQSIHRRLMERLNELIRNFNEIESDALSQGESVLPKDFELYHRYSEEKLYLKEREIEDENGHKKNAQVMQYRVTPTPSMKSIQSVAEFLNSIKVRADDQFTSREFLHNANYLYHTQVGKEGFWAQLAGYAEKMKSVDIDNIMLLPDTEIFTTAYRLYAKFLEESFTKFNWIHQHNMFTEDTDSVQNKIEQQVLKTLQVMFPDIKGKDAWRLSRAMSIARGLTKGIFANEVEMAAIADPPLGQKKGDPTFGSYYTFDNVALNALNLAHTAMRFQAEGLTKGPLFFMLIAGKKSDVFKSWDHAKLWDLIKQYHEAFVGGKSSIKLDDPSQQFFMDILLNIGRVGGIFTRAGWRDNYATEGWLKYKEKDGLQTEEVDVLPSWIAIENIGYQALLAFCNNPNTITDDFLTPVSSAREREIKIKDITASVDKDIADGKITSLDRDREIQKRKQDAGTEYKKLYNEKKAFFQYIYKKYIFPSSQSQELKHIEAEIDQLIQNDQLTQEERDHEIRIRLDKRVNRSFIEEQNRLKIEITKDVDRKIKSRTLKKEDRNKEIEKEVGKKILFQALAGVVRDRMPTKFIKTERNRTSDYGTRAWLKVFNKLNEKAPHIWKKEEIEVFDQAVSDISIVETALRSETTNEMKTHLLEEKEKTLYDFHKDDYVVTSDRVTTILSAYGYDESRILRAVQAFNMIKTMYCDDKEYMESFAKKIEKKEFAFAIGGEELETAFLAYRNAGPRILARSHGDTAKIDQGVAQEIIKYNGLLSQIAADPNHSMDKLIETIANVEHTVNSIHGAYGYEVAYKLAATTITYFKKDTWAKYFWSKPFVMGKTHSLAADFSGEMRGIWEWNTRDIDHFITELERRHILPKHPYDLTKSKKGKLDKSPAFKYYGGLLRKEFGATKKHIALELGLNYGPLVMFALLFEWLKDAWKEITGGNRQTA